MSGRVARQSAWALASSAGTAILQSATTALVAHWLRPSDFGVAAIVGVIVGLASALALLGLGTALTQAAKVEPEDAQAVLGLSLALACLLAALLALGVAPALRGPLGVPRLPLLVGVASLALPLGAVQGVAFGLLQRRLAFDVIARLQIAGVVLNALFTLAIAVVGGGVLALVAARLLADACLLGPTLRRAGAPWRPRFDCDRAARFTRFGLPVAGAQLLVALGSQLDTAVLAAMLGAGALGHYTLAFTLVMLPALRLAAAVKGVAFAALSRSAGVEPAFTRSACSLLRQMSIACCPLVIGLASVADDLVPLLLGPGWEATSSLLVRLAPTGVVAALGSAMGAILLARGRPGVELRFAVLRIFALGVLVLAGARMDGASGVACGVSLYHVAAFPLFSYFLQRFGGISTANVAAAIAPGLFAALGMAALVIVAGRELAHLPIGMRLALRVALGATSYTALIRSFFPQAWEEALLTVREARGAGRATGVAVGAR
ncbi:MAG TPA: oligosaccharide flippase family protein [Myxococcota bacterium]|nr:oligosaccharide flippase family protein [Myxococcota bacterium]